MKKQQKDELKARYIEYFKDVPVQKYAAKYIGRDADTIIRWRKEDVIFADAIEKSFAEWVRKKMLATKAEFALERLEREVFSPKVALDINQKLDVIPDPELSRAFTEFYKEYTARSVGNNST